MPRGTTMIQTNSSNKQVTETSNMQNDTQGMSQKDWNIAQIQDHMLREIKYLIGKDKLKEHKVYLYDQETVKQNL